MNETCIDAPYEDRARAVFKSIDIDNSGVLNYSELKRVFGGELAKDYLRWCDGQSSEEKRDMRIDMSEWIAFFAWAAASDDGFEPWLKHAESYVSGFQGGVKKGATYKKSTSASTTLIGNNLDKDLGGTFNTDSIFCRSKLLFEQIDADDSELEAIFGIEMSSVYIGWMDGFNKKTPEKASISWEVWVAFFEWTADPENAKVAGTEKNRLKWLDQVETYIKKNRMMRFEDTLYHIFRLYGGGKFINFSSKSGQDGIHGPYTKTIQKIIEKSKNTTEAHLKIFKKLENNFEVDVTPIINRRYCVFFFTIHNLREMNSAKVAEANQIAALDSSSFLGRALAIFRALDVDGSGELQLSELLRVFVPKQAADYQKWIDGRNNESKSQNSNIKDGVLSWAEWKCFFEWTESTSDGSERWLKQAEKSLQAKTGGQMAALSRYQVVATTSERSIPAMAAAEMDSKVSSISCFPPLPLDIIERATEVFSAIDTNHSGILESLELSKCFDPAQAHVYLSYMDGFSCSSSERGVTDGNISLDEWLAFFSWANSGGLVDGGCEGWLKQAEGYIERRKLVTKEK